MAVAAFNARFGASIASFDELQHLMARADVRAWYTAHRAERAAAAQLPAHLRDAGVTPDEYAATEAVRAQRKRIRADVAVRCARLTREYKAALQAAREDARVQLAACATPLVLAMEAGAAQLPLALRVSTATAERTDLERTVERARAVWVQQARDGILAFDPDAYPLMPL